MFVLIRSSSLYREDEQAQSGSVWSKPVFAPPPPCSSHSFVHHSPSAAAGLDQEECCTLTIGFSAIAIVTIGQLSLVDLKICVDL